MLAIGMAAYNKGDFLEASVEAVLEKTEGPYLFCVIDNCPPYADSQTYLQDLRKRDGIIVLGGKHNVGIARAHLAALNFMTNPKYYPLLASHVTHYVKVDDDTVMQTKGWDRFMLSAFKQWPRLAVLSADIDSGKQGGVPKVKKRGGLAIEVFEAPSVGGAFTMYPLSVFAKYGFFQDFGLYGHEDGEFAQRMRDRERLTAYLRNAKCIHLGRTENSDPAYDQWKTETWSRRTTLDYPSWRKETAWTS